MEKASEIARLDYEITVAVCSREHRPYVGDKFQEKRDRILELRKELFPESVWAVGTKKD